MSLKTAIKRKNISQVRNITKQTPLADIADMLQELSSSEILLYFKLMKTETRSEVFSHLEPEYQEQLINLFTGQQIRDIIGDLYTSEIVDLIEDLPNEMSEAILSNLERKTKLAVVKLLKYDENHTASIMNVDIILLKQTWTVQRAIDEVKNKKEDARLAHYYFVVDSKKRLSGFVSTEDLLFGKKTQKLLSLIHPSPFVTTTTDREFAAREFANYDMSVLPVVNSNKEVVGMITSDDVIDVLNEEATEDIERMAGIEKSDDTPYSKTSIWSIFKSRALWLMLLMFSATLSQIVLETFQDFANQTAAAVLTTAIVAIIPVISGAAGNAGSQSSTTIIRSLATGDLSTKDYLKVIWKEFRVSCLIGTLLGLANFSRLIIYYFASRDMDTEHIFLSLAASISLLAVIILAKFVGGLLPLVAKKLKIDPAVMAAPLLTTLIDALSTMIFFGISIGIMIMVL